MIKSSQSRDSYTLFPAGYSSTSSITSERMGAFGTMQLEEPPRAHTPTRMPQRGSHPIAAGYSPMVPTQNTPIMSTAGYTPAPGAGRRQNDYSAGPIAMKRPMELGMPNPYHHPTTVSNADTSETRRKYDKLTDVVSTSGDTVEFARNFNDYLNERIPYGITIGILAVLCLIAFIITLVGALNIPFCQVQPMIPIWLMVAGILFIISASIRIVRHIPDPSPRRQSTAARKSHISTNLCITGVEILFLGINLIWLICGCVWVYGARQYVHFRDQDFEEHFCDKGIYWTAFATVTGYIIFVCLLILMLICLLFVGSYKESQSESSDR